MKENLIWIILREASLFLKRVRFLSVFIFISLQESSLLRELARIVWYAGLINSSVHNASKMRVEKFMTTAAHRREFRAMLLKNIFEVMLSRDQQLKLSLQNWGSVQGLESFWMLRRSFYMWPDHFLTKSVSTFQSYTPTSFDKSFGYQEVNKHDVHFSFWDTSGKKKTLFGIIHKPFLFMSEGHACVKKRRKAQYAFVSRKHGTWVKKVMNIIANMVCFSGEQQFGSITARGRH